MKIGFIGGGALAESIIKGIVGKIVEAKDVYVSERYEARRKELDQHYKVNTFDSVNSFISNIDLLIIAVKPNDADAAMKEICSKVDTKTIVVYTVAGLELAKVEKYFKEHSVVRIMPNVAISVGEGMNVFTVGKNVNASAVKTVKEFFSTLGRCIEVEERLMDAVTGLSGSGPAYAFLMIDALSDGGVAAGLPRAKAIELAAQTLLGAAKMVLSSGEHPDVLRDKVTSPAGTTIEGVRVLESCGVRSALIEAVIAATEKSGSMRNS